MWPSITAAFGCPVAGGSAGAIAGRMGDAGHVAPPRGRKWHTSTITRTINQKARLLDQQKKFHGCQGRGRTRTNRIETAPGSVVSQREPFCRDVGGRSIELFPNS